MQQGRQVRDYPGVPGLMLPIEDVPVTPFQTDVESVARSIEEFMPDTSSNIAKGLARAEDKSNWRSEYFAGTQEELQNAQERAAEIERMIEAAKAAGMGFDEYIRDYENSGFAPSAPLEQSKPTKKTPAAEEAAPSVSDEAMGTGSEKAGGKEQSLVERYAAYKKLMEGDEEETGLSWPERLQIASAFFSAADAPSTGSFMGDLAQFGAKVGPGAAKGLTARDARELAAKKRRIESVKDFRDFARQSQIDDLERQFKIANISKIGAEAEKARADAAKLRGESIEYPDKPAIALIQEAEQVLNNIGGYKYNETKFDKQQITKPGTLGYDIAVLSQMLKRSPRDLIPILENTPDAIIRDNKGRSSLNRDMFFGGGRKVIQSKAEGGRVDDRPILRYPEDF